MFAIALTARAFPGDEGLEQLAVAALRMPAPEDAFEDERVAYAFVPGEADTRAKKLYDLLASDEAQLMSLEIGLPGTVEPPSTEDWWKTLVETAIGESAIPNSVGMFPVPCSGKVLTVPGIDGLAAAIRTDHETDADGPNAIDFQVATRFIEPRNWLTCMPGFWCEMEAMVDPSLPKGQKRYREVVSTHCGETGVPGFWARTELLFNFRWVPDETNPVAAIANYELAAGRPLPHDRIVVDEGTLVVAKVGDGETPLRITTTKRIKFSAPFPSGALALIMCAFGYADLTGNLLACAAARGVAVADALEINGDLPILVGEGDQVGVGHEFPGVAANVAAAAGGAGGYGHGGSGGYGHGGGTVVQEAMDCWARVLHDGARAVEGRGTYNKSGRPGG
jgi:hypothetical protein